MIDYTRTAEGELILLTLYAKSKTDNRPGPTLKEIAVHSKPEPLTDTELGTYEAERDPAADLLQAIGEMKAGEGPMVWPRHWPRDRALSAVRGACRGLGSRPARLGAGYAFRGLPTPRASHFLGGQRRNLRLAGPLPLSRQVIGCPNTFHPSSTNRMKSSTEFTAGP